MSRPKKSPEVPLLVQFVEKEKGNVGSILLTIAMRQIIVDNPLLREVLNR